MTPSKARRSLFGSICLIAFLAFNVVMLGLIAHLNLQTPAHGEDVMGRAYGTFFGVIIWVAGAAILGLVAFPTRARQT